MQTADASTDLSQVLGQQDTRVPLVATKQWEEEMDTRADDDQSVPYFFPDDRPIRHTLQVFPQSGIVE